MPPPLPLPAKKENQYPADLNQGPGTNAGANDVVKRITSQLAACPSAKFALVGYSQGARVVRIGATKLNKAALDRVVAAVVYGDAGDKPGARHAAKFPPEILAKLKDNCVKGDPVCRN
jgi:cutinase